MIRQIIFLEDAFLKLKEHILQDENEWAAFSLAEKSDPDATRIMISELYLIKKEEYSQQTRVFNSLSPETTVRIFNEFRNSDFTGFGEHHSHPFCSHASFSPVDDNGFPPFRADILRRKPQSFYFRMVWGQADDGFTCFFSDEQGVEHPVDELVIIGRNRWRKISRCSSISSHVKPLRKMLKYFSRNVEAFGQENQNKISKAKITVIGAGGIGNPLVQYLSRSGFQNIIVIDGDIVEAKNMNRLLSVTPRDLGHKKADVLRTSLMEYDPDLNVTSINEYIENSDLDGLGFLDCDFIIGGTDNETTRLNLQLIAAPNNIPYLDLGTAIFHENGKITEMGGNLRFYIPGHACLVCMGLDTTQIHSSEWRRNRTLAGYIDGTTESPGSVITINSILASLGVSVLRDYITGDEETQIPSYLIYDEVQKRIRHLDVSRSESCPICGVNGIAGTGMRPVPREIVSYLSTKAVKESPVARGFENSEEED